MAKVSKNSRTGKRAAAGSGRDHIKVIKSIKIKSEDEIREDLILGQYAQTSFGDQSINGYKDEEGVTSESKTETFAAITGHPNANASSGGILSGPKKEGKTIAKAS